jgi:hypothetical protein
MLQNFKSIALTRMFALKLTLTLLLFGAALAGFAQNGTTDRPSPSPFIVNHDPGVAAQGHYPGSQPGRTPFSMSETNFTALNDEVRRQSEQSTTYHSATYQELVERQRARAAQETSVRSRDSRCCEQPQDDAAPHANPDAPDQSEKLRNSRDRDFILHNFRTMYIDARDARYFGSAQLKAALGKNKDFWKLNVRIVDDPRVADAVLKVGYTFAWDYPFELAHQNTTIVLLSGKGEGPFSGPLGAADVARNFVNAAKTWRR